MKSRVIVLALASFVGSLSLTAQRMTFGPPPQSSPFPHSNSERGENSSITGTVQDSNNRPMKDVRVELRNSVSGSINSVYTNAAGGFEFSLVASGTYLVVATSGALQAMERVDASGWSNVVNLQMPTGNPGDGIGGNSISVAQYKVPAKARDEYRKGEDLFAKGKLDEANKHLAKALEICPNFADALTLRAVLKLNQKDVDGAITDLDQAVHVDANYAMAYMVLGAAFNHQAKFDEALRALERGESLSPNSWQTHFEMGKAYVGKKDYPQALHQFEVAQGMTPTEYPVIQLFRAHVLFDMKEYSRAAEAAQAYLLKEPQGPNSEQARKMLTQAQESMARK